MGFVRDVINPSRWFYRAENREPIFYDGPIRTLFLTYQGMQEANLPESGEPALIG